MPILLAAAIFVFYFRAASGGSRFSRIASHASADAVISLEDFHFQARLFSRWRLAFVYGFSLLPAAGFRAVFALQGWLFDTMLLIFIFSCRVAAITADA